MSNVMNLAIQITAIDMLSSVVERVKHSVLSLGSTSGKVKRDFDLMTNHITKGLKAIAISSYALNKALPGIMVAASMEEAMLKVKANLISSVKEAKELEEALGKVKGSAIEISQNAPFSAEEVVNIEAMLLKAGVAMEHVLGKTGAAWAATALATLSGEAPEAVGDAMARIGDIFNFTGPQYGEFADWLSRVDEASASTLPELIYGLKMAGTQAAALGIGFKDTVTAMGALAPLGDRASESLANFYTAVAVRREKFKKGNIKLFEKGKFVGMERAIDVLKKKFGDIKDDELRLGLLMELFGEQGGRAANQFIKSKKGFKELNKEAQNAAGVTEKLAIWAEGFNASLKKLAGTAKTTLGTLFNPILEQLKPILDMLNDIIGKIGKLAQDYPGVATAVSGGAVGIGSAAGAYGVGRLVLGGLAGGRVLKGVGGIKGLLKGLGGTAAGVAEGKIVQGATGIPSVFVVGGRLDSVGSVGSINGMTPPGTPPGTPPVPAKGGAGMLKAGAALLPVAAVGYGVYEFSQYMGRQDVKLQSMDRLAQAAAVDRKMRDATTNVINMRINVDQAGRATTYTDDANTKINLQRGRFTK